MGEAREEGLGFGGLRRVLGGAAAGRGAGVLPDDPSFSSSPELRRHGARVAAQVLLLCLRRRGAEAGARPHWHQGAARLYYLDVSAL